MAPRFQNARSNGNTLTITVVDNSNPVTDEEIDFRHVNAELQKENIELKAENAHLERQLLCRLDNYVRRQDLNAALNCLQKLRMVHCRQMPTKVFKHTDNEYWNEIESLHSEVADLLDSVRPRPNNPYREGEIT